MSRPVSPLQAARLARRWLQPEAVEKIRAACPGHGSAAGCLLPMGRLSRWEHGRERPTPQHIEALCKTYESSPEDLGLVSPQAAEERARQARRVPAWLREQIRAEVRAELRREVTVEVVAAAIGHLRGLVKGDGPPE